MYYVDTNIWMDFHENRKDRFRPLGDWAAEFLQKCLDKKIPLISSDIV